MANFKLYIWAIYEEDKHGFSRGEVFAMAETKEQAKSLILKKDQWMKDKYFSDNHLEVLEGPCAYTVIE